MQAGKSNWRRRYGSAGTLCAVSSSRRFREEGFLLDEISGTSSTTDTHYPGKLRNSLVGIGEVRTPSLSPRYPSGVIFRETLAHESTLALRDCSPYPSANPGLPSLFLFRSIVIMETIILRSPSSLRFFLLTPTISLRLCIHTATTSPSLPLSSAKTRYPTIRPSFSSSLHRGFQAKTPSVFVTPTRWRAVRFR